MLATRYRPRKFSDIIAQPEITVLYQMVLKDCVPQALCFTGSWGTGKTSTARVLAAALNCELQDPEPCTTCSSCVAVFEDASPALIEIDAASNGHVENMRTLRRDFEYASSVRNRVYVIDESQSLRIDAWNVLLKILEDMPSNVYIITLTTEEHKIPETVKDRMMPFKFRRVSVGAIASRLAAVARVESIEIQPELLTLLAARANGSLRNGLMMLDQMSRAHISTPDQFHDLYRETDFAPTMLAHMSLGNHHKVAEIIDEEMYLHGDYRLISAELTHTLRDILILKNGGALAYKGSRLSSRQLLATRLDAARIVKCMKLLWDLKVKLRNDDPRASVEILTVLLTDILAGGSKVTAKNPVETRPMSIDEIRKFSG